MRKAVYLLALPAMLYVTADSFRLVCLETLLIGVFVYFSVYAAISKKWAYFVWGIFFVVMIVVLKNLIECGIDFYCDE